MYHHLMLRAGTLLARRCPIQAEPLLLLCQHHALRAASSTSYEGASHKSTWGAWTLGLAASVSAAAVAWHWGVSPTLAEAKAQAKLPSYTKEEVSKHKSKEQRIWVTYKDGVYDITDFVAMHPGGAAKIMMAAGGAVDPFWAMYQQHRKPEVADILKEYRIGTLSDYKAGAAATLPGDPWVDEPQRHPALVYRSTNPCNAETPGDVLTGNLVTPTDLFYVRNHLPVPHLDASAWRLVVEGEGLKRLELSLHTLQKNFKKHTLASTVQCAGNRRNEMKQVKAVKGLDWDTGAIGTAVWGGVRLIDVLQAAGMDVTSHSAEGAFPAAHIHFVGADRDPASGDNYGASVPIDIAAAPHRDVLLAYEMNGEPLTPDHGYPVRVIVPGVAGARNVKWLAKVVASKEESSSHWQQRDYKGFSPSTDWDTVDWDSAPAIQDMPITSAITEPAPGTKLSKGAKEVTVRGYAWSGGGRDVVRVDVSSDGGKSWSTAELKKLPQQRGRAWAWTLWEAEVPVAQDKGPVQLVVKATDSSYNTQPDTVAGVWNLRGVINNAWHRVTVHKE